MKPRFKRQSRTLAVLDKLKAPRYFRDDPKALERSVCLLLVWNNEHEGVVSNRAGTNGCIDRIDIKPLSYQPELRKVVVEILLDRLHQIPGRDRYGAYDLELFSITGLNTTQPADQARGYPNLARGNRDALLNRGDYIEVMDFSHHSSPICPR